MSAHSDWKPGRLLITHRTKRWTQEARDEIDEIEKCHIFAHFFDVDEGRSRECIMKCDTPQVAIIICKVHNFIGEMYEQLLGVWIYLELSRVLSWMQRRLQRGKRIWKYFRNESGHKGGML